MSTRQLRRGLLLILAISSVSLAVEPKPKTNPPPLLFLHGFTCNPSSWRYQVRYFEKNFQVFAPILPLHAGSSLEAEPTVEGLAKAMIRYVDDEIGTPPVVIGHSLGGMVALHMALTAPDKLRAIVLADSFPSLEVSQRNNIKLYAPKTPDSVRLEADAMMAKGREEMLPENRKSLWKSIAEMDVVPRLSEVDLPVLGIYGGRDRYRPDEANQLKSDMSLDRIPSVEVVIIGGAGHFVQLEQPQVFNERLEEFLEDLNRGASLQ